MNQTELKKKAKAYALKNAVMHNGKAIPGAVISALFNEGLKKTDMKKHYKIINEIIEEVNSYSPKKQITELEKLSNEISERETREGLPELENVPKKGVVMRFAPSPSGALHIGHALTASISFLFVEKYGGKFYVRIEDTNPDNILPEAYDLIKQDSDWLFKKKEEIVIQSERMELYYKYAEKLIKKNAAYVCTCSPDEFKEYVMKKKNCPCRELTKKYQLERWNKMFLPVKEKGYDQGHAILRFKTPSDVGGMKHKNPAMRDFPLARINLTEHPKQKDKYKVWPLMNLSVTIDDIEMKMTHIIRAKEHMDNAKRQKLIYKVLGKEYPWEAYLGRYHFTDLELSASKITKEVKEGKYSGWDDERLPTLQALKKKGYKPEAFWKMAEQRGLSSVDKKITSKDFFELLNNFNKAVE